MGLIKRQGIKNSFFNFFGVALGAISTLFIYPLNWELYGFLQFILATASIGSAFLLFGSNSLISKYYPFYKKNGYSGFFKSVFLFSLLVMSIVFIFFFSFKDLLFRTSLFSAERITLFNEYYLYISALSALTVIVLLFRLQAANFGRIVVPDLLQKTGFKFLLPIIIYLSYLGYVNQDSAKSILLLFYVLIAIAMVIYLKSLNALDFHEKIYRGLKKSKLREMFSFMSFSFINQLGNNVIFRADVIMLGMMINSKAVAFYSTYLFFASVISIPTLSIFKITAPIISKEFENDNMLKISELYKKTSITLIVIGCFIFGMIWINIDSLLQIMKNGDDLVIYKYIFLFLGGAKLLDMITSLNFHIITYSKFFKSNFYFLLFLASLNVLLNYIFITKYGLIGAGLATFCSLTLYNIIKSIYVYIKFKMHPFSKQYIKMIFLVLLIVLMSLYKIETTNVFINVMVTSSVFALLYLFIAFKLNLSKDLNKQINKGLDFFKNLFA